MCNNHWSHGSHDHCCKARIHNCPGQPSIILGLLVKWTPKGEVFSFLFFSFSFLFFRIAKHTAFKEIPGGWSDAVQSAKHTTTQGNQQQENSPFAWPILGLKNVPEHQRHTIHLGQITSWISDVGHILKRHSWLSLTAQGHAGVSPAKLAYNSRRAHFLLNKWVIEVEFTLNTIAVHVLQCCPTHEGHCMRSSHHATWSAMQQKAPHLNTQGEGQQIDHSNGKAC